MQSFGQGDYDEYAKCFQKCPDTDDPVCSVDGYDYDNECDLKCAGNEMEHKGPCKTDSGEDIEEQF